MTKCYTIVSFIPDDCDVQPAFDFGTSSPDSGRDFLSSPLGSTMFGQNNNQGNESFGGGFSIFGSTSSTARGQGDNTGDFSFSFCGGNGGEESPSDSNHGSTGFSLF